MSHSPNNPLIREIGLLFVDDENHRSALREVGEMIYDMALETYRGTRNSLPYDELRAVQADLVYLGHYLGAIERLAQENEVSTTDEELCAFASSMAPKVSALAADIDRALS